MNGYDARVERPVQVGDLVVFRRPDGERCQDVVRALFVQTVCLEPYGRDFAKPAAVLTHHSWCFIEDIIEVAL